MESLTVDRATVSLRAIVRSGIRPMREFSHNLRLFGQAGRGPSAIFLPCEGREGAALLRSWDMAAALRETGWRSLALSPSLTLDQRRRLLRIARPDVIVMQGSRHALNRPGLYRGAPVVYDIDDADFHLPHLERAVRAAMPEVAAVTAGSRYIADWCRGAGAGEVRVVWTGTPVSARPRPPQRGRGPVVAWAQTRPMTYTREAALVREVMARVGAARPGTVLRLFDRLPGDDPGFAESFHAPGLTVEWVARRGYGEYLALLDDVAVGLAPLAPETPFSRGKSFGKVLACLDRQVPVVASEAGEHGRFFTRETGVLSNDGDVWVGAIAGLLDDGDARQRMAEAAFGAFRAQLTTGAAAARLINVLRGVITSRTSGARRA